MPGIQELDSRLLRLEEGKEERFDDSGKNAYNAKRGKGESFVEQKELLAILREQYNLETASLQFLRDGGGTAYIVKNADRKYLLKVVGNAFARTAHQSVAIMRYLEDQEFPVPQTVLTKDGLPMLEAELNGQNVRMVLQKYIDGKEPDLKLRAEEVGALVGRLHKLLNDYPGELVLQEYTFFVGRYLNFLRQKGYSRLLEYTELGEKLWQRVKGLPVGNCHGDLHRGNLLETQDGTIYLLDFDTVCRAPIMFDVMVMCDMTDYFHLKSADVQTTREVYARFLMGYAQTCPLSHTERRSFYDWVAIRHFQLQATMIEIYGIDCMDEKFVDMQLDWLKNWLQAVEGCRDGI